MSTLTPSPAVDPLAHLLSHVSYAPLSDTGWVRVTGEDRVRWLNGMVTNSIQALTPGQGCYTFFLSAQGRIQGDATAFALEDAILLETDRKRVELLTQLLDRFIIMDDVELETMPDRAGLLIAGPLAAASLSRLGIPVDPAVQTGISRQSWQGLPLDVVCAESPLVPRFELWSDAKTAEQLAVAFSTAGVPLVPASAIEQLRLLEGTPLYGVDIRDKELPQETVPVGTESRALHFSKGCYLGQEIVERIRSRGNVHRLLSGFVLTGELPPAGTPLATSDAPEKPVGEITSVAEVGGSLLALGYVRREALERNANLSYPGGTAIVSRLPFTIPSF